MAQPHRLLALAALLASVLLGALPAAGREEPSFIHLRRLTFDPLRDHAALAGEGEAAAGGLLLVQLGGPPTAPDIDALRAAGLLPLLYIPDNTFLVRASALPRQALASVAGAGVRWAGPLPAAAKLHAALDPLLAKADAPDQELRVVAAPDADPDALADALAGVGARVLARGGGLNGATLRVLAPAASLGAIAARDDVVWVEQYIAPQAFGDRARPLLGLTAPTQQLWLSGAGQIVAVTDTGLDVESNLSADFAGRVAAGFANSDMVDPELFPSCAAGDWSDRHGHGTHVAGILLGSGVLSGGQFAGVAPGARLVIQSVSSGGNTLNCFPQDQSFLQLAYDAGARIQNGSFGGPSGFDSNGPIYGGYTAEDQDTDSYLWQHRDHLFVAAVGNSGADDNGDGVVDADSVNSPGSAKNVLTVGATENDRPPSGTPCVGAGAESLCWKHYGFSGSPALLAEDPISDNPSGMAAFSGRGPTDDGRIKPEIAAPGTNIIAARSHHSFASYYAVYNAHYAYLSGTSMAAPMVSGLAALARQWLIDLRGAEAPSAALLKALLLNGAVSTSPGQYGVGTQQEIGADWPNATQGWGRASLGDTVGLGGLDRVWFADAGGLLTGGVAEYSLDIAPGQPLRVTLAWTDYPGTPLSGKALVNNLDLEVVPPGGPALLGNAAAALPATCRSALGADTCNNSESVEIASPAGGRYTVRVRGAFVNPLGGAQPFALAVRAAEVTDAALPAPTLQPIQNAGKPALPLAWSGVPGASFYRVELSGSSSFSEMMTLAVSGTATTVVQDVGTRFVRVRACAPGGCGAASAVQSAVVTTAPHRAWLPAVVRAP